MSEIIVLSNVIGKLIEIDSGMLYLINELSRDVTRINFSIALMCLCLFALLWFSHSQRKKINELENQINDLKFKRNLTKKKKEKERKAIKSMLNVINKNERKKN